MDTGSDLKAIGVVIKDYVEGMYYLDLARLRTTFHPTACLYGHLNEPSLGFRWISCRVKLRRSFVLG